MIHKNRRISVVDHPFGFEENLAKTDESDKDLRKDGLVCREPLYNMHESHGGREHAREEIRPRGEKPPGYYEGMY